MINVGYDDAVVSIDKSAVEWQPGMSLDELVTSTFPNTLQGLNERPKMINAHDMERMCGFKILWTGNLADHLLLDDQRRTILFYHHASVLKANQDKTKLVKIPSLQILC
jgi:hypothetical protein